MYKKGHYNKIQKQISNDLLDGITATEAYITGALVDSREKSMAITKLDEALMWIGAAIAAGVKEEPKKCKADPKDCPLCKILEQMTPGEEKVIEICIEE